MENVIQIDKTQWVDEFKKLTAYFKSEERALIQTFLSNDYHLSKIYKTMLQDDITFEGKAFVEIEKRLKYSINEAFSYFKGMKATKGNNIDIRNKIRLIEEMVIRIRNEFKSKFEELLLEEDSLEKELSELDAKFSSEYFKDSSNDNDINTCKDNDNDPNDNKPNEKQRNNRDLIDEYINLIMSSVNMIYEGGNEECSLASIEKLLKKFSYKDLQLIKAKSNMIDLVIEQSLGGTNLSWQQKEHEDFLKLRTIHNNKINTYEFLNELSSLIPYLPLSELKTHIRKFDKFTHLLSLKKILIQKYKDIKAQKESEDKQKALEKINENRQMISAKNINVNIENNQKNKEKVKEWKEKKERDHQEKIAFRSKLEREKKEKEITQYKNKKEQNQQMIDDFKQRKENERILMMMTNSKMNQCEKVDPIDVERIREREEALLEKRKNAVRAKSSKYFKSEMNYQKYKIKSQIKLDKMETKINQMTEDFKSKARHKFDPKKDKSRDACTMANNVLNHMSRAVPEWRKGL